MLRFRPNFSRRFAAIALACGTTITGVGAATLHRYAVVQSSGSAGATAFVQTGSASNSALQGEVASSANTGISIPFGVLGEYNPVGSTFGIGTIGISTTGYGLAGESLSDSQPSILANPGGRGIGLEAVSASDSSNPAIDAEANGSGDGGDFIADGGGYGIAASSKDFTGIFGVSSASDNNPYSGVMGTGYTGVAGLDIDVPSDPGQGVVGASAAGYGTYGAGGYIGAVGANTATASPGPTASPYADAGVVGMSSVGDGVYAASTSGIGLYASSNDDALVATSQTGYSVYGISHGGSVGRLGEQGGTGVEAIGSGSNTSYPALKITGKDSSGPDLVDAYSYAGGSHALSFEVQGGTANRSGQAIATESSDVQISGDLYVFGQVFQDCDSFPVTGTGTNATPCAPVPIGSESTTVRSANGTNVAMYGSHETAPTIETVGTAQLVYGRAYVALDPNFAQTISMQSPYWVFITPRGDSRGVFVSNSTPRGFEVHENAGGRSSLAFDYRIVGKPLAETVRNVGRPGAKAMITAVPDPVIASELRELRADLKRANAVLASTSAYLAHTRANASSQLRRAASMREGIAHKRATVAPIHALFSRTAVRTTAPR